MTFSDNISCVCGEEQLIFPYGNKASDILIIVSKPAKDDYATCKPLQGGVGGIFKAELKKVGIDANAVRYAPLWWHDPNGDAACFARCLEILMKEMAGKKYVLLCGVEAVKYFTGYSPETHAGLQVSSLYMPHKKIMVCHAPGVVFSALGEMRLTMKKFKRMMEID